MMIINIQTTINEFIFIFFILLCYDELFSSFFYCADGSKKDSKEDSKEESKKDSKEDSKEDLEVDKLANLVKEHLRITKDIKNINNELSLVDRAEKQSENLPEGANNNDSDERFLTEHFGNSSYKSIKYHLEDELERLKDSKKM